MTHHVNDPGHFATEQGATTEHALVAHLHHHLHRLEDRLFPLIEGLERSGHTTHRLLEEVLRAIHHHRQPIARLVIGGLSEEPIGGTQAEGVRIVAQVHDNKQAVQPISAVDSAGNAVPFDATAAAATSDNPALIAPATRQDADGPKLVVVPVLGGGLGAANVTVTITNADGTTATSAPEPFEVIASDAIAVNFGAVTEEPHP